MKRMNPWRWVVAALLLAAGGATVRAEDLKIQSFDGTGRLVYDPINSATNYRIEWASSPAGPWTNFAAAAAALDSMPATTHSVTCSVPMCYRVVASVPPTLYLVVDLSDGPSASSYPVSYLAAVPPGGWTDEYKTTKLVMRRILATTPSFSMGSPPGELGRENGDETQHQVTLTKDFYIGVFEVTQRQWELVMGNKPSYFNNAAYYQTRPVEQVTYYHIRENPANIDDPAVNWPNNSVVNANSFMGKMRAKTGLAEFDLPTESQWEHACRAGTTTALNSGYNLTSTTNDPRMSEVGRNYANHPGGYSSSPSVNTNGGTAAVGSYLGNAWGLYDMHGNAMEWCLDWWDGISPGPVTDPKGPTASGTDARVIRSGSWDHYPHACRSALRYNITGGQATRSRGIGFRACSAAPSGHP